MPGGASLQPGKSGMIFDIKGAIGRGRMAILGYQHLCAERSGRLPWHSIEIRLQRHPTLAGQTRDATACRDKSFASAILGLPTSRQRTQTWFCISPGTNHLMSASVPSLRTHQAQMLAIVQAIAAGEASELTDLLAAVTPGGGKSLLPVIAGAILLSARLIDRVCWVVPRDSLRLQAEEAFADGTARNV
jgi:hypothetical protein